MSKTILRRPIKNIEGLCPHLCQSSTRDKIDFIPVANPQRETQPTTVGTLWRAGRRITRLKESETIFVMFRRNYRIDAYLEPTRQAVKRYSFVFDTGDGSSFVKAALIPAEFRQLIQPLEDHVIVRDAYNRAVMIAGTILLVANVGNRTSTTVKFNVVERLGKDSILGYDSCDAHVEVSFQDFE